MSSYQFDWVVKCQGKGTYELTDQLASRLQSYGVQTGLCHVFLQHTSASLMLCENADPDVRHDLEALFSRMVPEGDPLFVHQNEGPDDMPAHARSVLMGSELTVPIRAGRLALGTWQGIYLWEHRQDAMQRHLVVTVLGD